MDFRNYNKRDVHMHTLLENTNGFYFVTHFPNFVGKCEKNCFVFLPYLVHLTELQKVPESVNPVCRKYFGLFHPGVPVPQGKQVG